jgi:predicted nucleotidyltransferase
MIHPEIKQHIPAIQALCREYGVAKLEIFGSAVTDEFDPERSDVDFLVTFPEDYDFGPWIGKLFDMEEELARVLGRDVDLVMLSALENKWFRREAEKTRTVIFDASEVSEVA